MVPPPPSACPFDITLSFFLFWQSLILYIWCGFFRCRYVGYSLGPLPPPCLLTPVNCGIPYRPPVHGMVHCPNVSTHYLLVSSAASTRPPPGPATLPPTISLAYPLTQSVFLPIPPPPSGGLIPPPAGGVLPKKTVENIHSWQFVVMIELLSDNISLLQQLEATHG